MTEKHIVIAYCSGDPDCDLPGVVGKAFNTSDEAYEFMSKTMHDMYERSIPEANRSDCPFEEYTDRIEYMDGDVRVGCLVEKIAID